MVYLFYCILSIYACTFKLLYIFKFFFSCTVPEISILVARTDTKPYRLSVFWRFWLRGLFIYHMPSFIQHYIPLFLFFWLTEFFFVLFLDLWSDTNRYPRSFDSDMSTKKGLSLSKHQNILTSLLNVQISVLEMYPNYCIFN